MSFRVLFAVALVVAPCAVPAADLSGEIAIGARTVEVSGAENKYREDINLDDGARLLGVSLVLRDGDATGFKPHLIDLDVRNLGGDPYESIRLTVKKYGAYAFEANRRRSDWFYDDLIVLPEDASINRSTGGDFHRFDVQRVRDDVSLTADLNERAKLRMGFARSAKTGESETTLDISRDEFELDKPVDEMLETWRIGLDYRWEKTRISLEERVHDYGNNGEWFLPGFSEGQNPGNLTTLDFYFLNTPYSYRSHEHAVRLYSRPADRVQVSAMVLFGELDLETRIDERAQGTDFTGQPLQTEERGGGGIGRDSTAVDLSLRYVLTDRLSLSAGLRQRRLDQSGSVAFSAAEGGQGQWDIDSRIYDIGMSWQAAESLLISAGWTTQQRNVDSSKLQAGGTAVVATDDSDASGGFLNVDYRPNRRFRLNARFNDHTHDDPFSLAAPSELTRYGLRASYRADNGLQVAASHARNDRENDLGRWSASTRQSTITLSRITAKLALSLGTTFVDASNRYDRVVIGGSRQDLIDADYVANTDYVDAAVRWRVDERWSLGGYWRRYDNDGSFKVERDDWQTFVDVKLPRNYSLSICYRDIAFEEGDIEHYDARIWEAAIRLAL